MATVPKALYIDSLIDGNSIPFPNDDFQKLVHPAGDRAYVQFRYSCLDDSARVPIRAQFLVHDRDGVSVALDAIKRNREYVESHLRVVEEHVGPANIALVSLKNVLRRREAQ